jgi:hypothetical protein
LRAEQCDVTFHEGVPGLAKFGQSWSKDTPPTIPNRRLALAEVMDLKPYGCLEVFFGMMVEFLESFLISPLST